MRAPARRGHYRHKARLANHLAAWRVQSKYVAQKQIARREMCVVSRELIAPARPGAGRYQRLILARKNGEIDRRSAPRWAIAASGVRGASRMKTIIVKM